MRASWTRTGTRFTECASCGRPYVGTNVRCMDCREARMRRALVAMALLVAFLVGLGLAVGR